MDNYKRKSLRIIKQHYKEACVPHEAYVNTYYSTRRQTENINDGPSIGEINVTQSKLQIDLPFPICTPKITTFTGNDECLDLLSKKEKYTQKLKHCQGQYKFDKKWLKPAYVNQNSHVVIPKYVIDIATGVTKDVDPFFNSYYDYYYTGGNLSQLIFNEIPYLIRPTHSDNLCISSVKKPKKFHEITLNENPIYNIKTYLNNKSNLISVRQKNVVFYIDLNLVDDNLECKTLFMKQSKKVPYLDLKAFGTNEIALLNANYNIDFTDVEHNEIQLSHKFPLINKKHELGQFEYINCDNILFTDPKQIHKFDKRSLCINTTILSSGHFECNDLCTFIISKLNNNYVYIISKHDIIKLDLREMKVVKKWPHLLGKTPTVCKICVHDNEEFLCVSSFNERVLLQMNSCDNYIPLYVPNVVDTLNRCNIIERFNLNEDLQMRLGLSIPGLEIMQCKANENISIFTSNSIGDIFRSNVNTSQLGNNKPLEKLNAWIDLLPNKTRTLIATDFREMNDVKHVFSLPIKEKNLEYMKGANPKRLKLLKSFENINQYHLATIWNDDHVNIDQVDNNPDTATHKVVDWLQKTQSGEQSNDSFDVTKFHEYDDD